jgi:sigma-54 dependent transcriptional regulator, acetoin dehydrogenase operon transcriptional activator AcoR
MTKSAGWQRSTLSRHAKPSRASGVSSYLFLVFQCDAPHAPSLRLRLDEVESVEIGRSREPSAAQVDRSGGRVAVRIPDSWMSSSHALLHRVLGSWVLEDTKSKNGTLLNGQVTERAELADGDLIELGHSFICFRSGLAGPANGPAVVTADRLQEPAVGLVTLMPSLAEEFEKLEAIAPSSVCVVIRGESGTGKEVIAAAVHKLSRRSGPFVPVNCGALSRGLVESELFGYRKGAFSGAEEDRVGIVRAADRGTLFLDEIGDLPLSAQTVLLRVLQEGEVLPVGANRAMKVDIRLVAATHRDLDAMVERNEFRADLLARISGFTLSLPPLRQRREDLGLLISRLLKREASERAGRVEFTADAARAVLAYPWPLNIRELGKCLLPAVILARNGPVELSHFPESIRGSGAKKAWRRLGETPGDREQRRLSESDRRRREEIRALLQQHSGNVTAVAQALGKARSQVQRWIRRYRLDVKDFRG